MIGEGSVWAVGVLYTVVSCVALFALLLVIVICCQGTNDYAMYDYEPDEAEFEYDYNAEYVYLYSLFYTIE